MSSSSDGRRTIAFFPPRLVSGGTQRHLLEVLKFLDRDRFRSVVLSVKCGGDLGDAVVANGAELVELHVGERMLSADVGRAIRRSAAIFRERGVDIAQSFAWRPGLIALAAARLTRRVRVVAGRRSTPQERGVRAVLEELVVQLADRVIVNAESLRPRGLAGRRTEVVPSGVDSERFRPRPDERDAARTRLGIAPGRRLIGTVGRLEARKGTATLIDALGCLRARGRQDVVVAVAGDGPLRETLAAQAARLGVGGDVLLLGDRADVRDILTALDAFVLPSHTEGMSNALLEAMATACPVVATAVGGTPEVVVSEVSGILVPGGDAEAMAAAIERLLDAPELAARLGAAARRRVEERYGARAMVRRLEAIYAALAASNDTPAHVQPAAANEHA